MGYANGYSTTITAGINNSVTSCTVASTTGIPATPFTAVIAAEGANTDEIVQVTNNSSGTFTITRAYELTGGNGASAHGSGATLAAVLTAGEVAAFRTALVQTYYGYNTAGGSVEAMTDALLYFKSFTLSAAAQITEVSAYLELNAQGVFSAAAGIYTDSSGSPLTQIAVSTLGPNGIIAQPATTQRWLAIPCPVYLASGTYWMMFAGFSGSGNMRLAYDGSGSDVKVQMSGTYIGDNVAGLRSGSPTVTSNQYSIRASALS